MHQFSVAHLGTGQIVEEWDNLSETELLAMPEVQELYASFAGLFSPRDCARALGYNQGDFEDAANWLIDSQSQQPKTSNGWKVPRTKATLICESVLASKWTDGPGNKNHEQEVQCVKNSVLTPASIAAGRWTLNADQVSFHSIDPVRNITGVSYVFSRDQPGSLKELYDTEPEATDKMLQETWRAHSNDDSYYWDGTAWHAFTKQQVAESRHIELKSKKMAELEKAGDEKAKAFELVSEWDLYEPIAPKSTLLKVVEDRQSLLLSSHSNYITYDPYNKRFMAITLEQSFRNVIIYDDLTELIPKTLPSPTAESQAATDFKSFMKATVSTLCWANQNRYQMPWRWNQWSDVYGKALMHLDPDLGGRPFVHDPSRKPATEEAKVDEEEEEQEEGKEPDKELRIKNVKRLKKRQQQVREREAILALRKLGLDVMSGDDAAAYRNQVAKLKR